MRHYDVHLAQQTEQDQGHGFVAQLWRNWKARRAVSRLADYDDFMLRDIGVTRDEIYAASRLPLRVNAAQALANNSTERRISTFWSEKEYQHC